MRCVFAGCPAFLGRVDSQTRCAFWAQEPTDHGFDPGRLIDVDLALTPSAAAAGQIGWDQVQVDDCFTGPGGQVSGSTLGPRWPELHLAGAVYLERGFAASLPRPLRPGCPPPGASGQPYEYQTAVYWPGHGDPRGGRRYSGHHGQILAEQGTLARVAVHPPGRSQQPHLRPTVLWVDLACAEQCDAGPGSLTTIGVGDAPKRGALFLISGQLPSRPQETP
jgi:hypothetical protein